jgi:hypothetical protein
MRWLTVDRTMTDDARPRTPAMVDTSDPQSEVFSRAGQLQTLRPASFGIATRAVLRRHDGAAALQQLRVV